MGAVVKAKCTDCEQDVLLDARYIVLYIKVGLNDLVGPDSYYSFICPECLAIVVRPADMRVAHLLLLGECQWETDLVTAH